MKTESPFRGGVFRLTSPYGERTINGEKSNHKGIDLVGINSYDVCSVTDGTVVKSAMVTDKSDLTWQWGNYICIRGGDGRYIYYCHLASRNVAAGESVSAGQKIGVMGNTGYSFGAHLHFEVRGDDRKTAQNAADYLGITNKEGIYNIAAEKSADGGEDGGNNPASWAEEAVEWAKDAGILLGNAGKDGNADYRLHDGCTREQIAVFLYRFYEYLKKGGV